MNQIKAIQIETAELTRQVAELQLEVNQYRAERSGQINDEELKQSKLLTRFQQERLRPSNVHGPALRQGDNGEWLAMYGDLVVKGDTPELAMENFDAAWAFGETEHLGDNDADGFCGCLV